MIHLFDVTTGEHLQDLVGHTGVVWELDFDPSDRNRLLSTSADGTFRLWNIESGRHLLTLTPCEGWDVSVGRFASATEVLLSGANGDALLVDLTAYDRNIAGNLEYQILLHTDALGERMRAEELRSWASRR